MFVRDLRIYMLDKCKQKCMNKQIRNLFEKN